MNAQQPSRKKLIPKSQRKRRAMDRTLTTVISGRVEKSASKVNFRLPRDLTPEQVEEAQYLASIIPGQQRPDAELLRSMRKKSALSADTATISSPPSPPRTPTVQSAPKVIPIASNASETVEWEAEALKAIKKNKLSLDKVWNSKTWSMKTSMPQRLKLLKDDGYDITPLLVKGTTSDQVTQAVLARVEARKLRTVPAKAHQNVEVVVVPSIGYQDEATRSIQEAVESVEQEDKLPQGPQDELSPESATDSLPERRVQVPQAFVPQKRKYDYENENRTQGNQQGTSTCGPARKKLRMSTPEESNKNMEFEALQLFKRHVARNIFQASRAVRKVITPEAVPTLNPVSAPQPAFAIKPPVPASRIILASQDPSPRTRKTSDVHIGSRGFAFLLDELEFLSNTHGSDGSLCIRDPDVDGHRPDDNKEACLMEYKPPHAVGDYNLIDERYRHSIVVSQDSQGRIIMGDALALQGLMKQLREHDLIHTSKWRFDGMMVIPEDKVSWSLSTATLESLQKIENMLEAGRDRGGVVVRVEQIYDGKKLRYC